MVNPICKFPRLGLGRGWNIPQVVAESPWGLRGGQDGSMGYSKYSIDFETVRGRGWVMIGSENVAELQENWTVTVRALRAWLVDTKMGMTLISLHDSCWHVGGNSWNWARKFLSFFLTLGLRVQDRVLQAFVYRVSSRERWSCYKACRHLWLVSGISFCEFGQIPMMQVAYIYKNRIIRCYNIHMNLYTFSWTPPETRHCASSEPQPSVTTKGFFRATEVRESQGHKGDRRSTFFLHGWGFSGFRYFSSQIFEEVKFSDGFRGRESSFSQGVTWGENKAYLPYGSVDSPTAAVVRPRKSFDRILQTSWTNFKSGFLWFTCETPSSFPLT